MSPRGLSSNARSAPRAPPAGRTVNQSAVLENPGALGSWQSRGPNPPPPRPPPRCWAPGEGRGPAYLQLRRICGLWTSREQQSGFHILQDVLPTAPEGLECSLASSPVLQKPRPNHRRH